jgi:hypothetical protein
MVKGEVQRIELHRGCPWADLHDYCYEPKEHEDFPIPTLLKNEVQILDMNFLARKDHLDIIRQLGSMKVNSKVVRFELICGVDFRLLTEDTAKALKEARFVRPRLAWDGPFADQDKIKKAILMLTKAGYTSVEIMVFMIVNWRISYSDCLRKLDLLKVWRVKVCDCCYDGGYKHAVPKHWTQKEIESIRIRSRKHNQLVLFGIDPQASINPYLEEA